MVSFSSERKPAPQIQSFYILLSKQEAIKSPQRTQFPIHRSSFITGVHESHNPPSDQITIYSSKIETFIHSPKVRLEFRNIRTIANNRPVRIITLQQRYFKKDSFNIETSLLFSNEFMKKNSIIQIFCRIINLLLVAFSERKPHVPS